MSVAETSPLVNRQFRLAAHPVGLPKETDFALVESRLEAPADGEVLAKAVYISVDPYMRSKMSGVSSYSDPIGIGDTMVGLGIGRVIESHSPAFAAGDFVLGEWGWREYARFGWQGLDQAASAIGTGVPEAGGPRDVGDHGVLRAA